MHSRYDQIKLSVANDSPPLQRFLGTVLSRGVGNFSSRQAICGKTKSLTGQIVR